MSAKSFVNQFLIDKDTYTLEAKGSNPGEFYQFVYKIQKSPAVQKLELWEKGIVEIPRWIVFSSIMVFVFLAVLFSGSLYVLGNLKPDSIYNESCTWRPCLKAHNLKCINKICTCESPKYYRGKCFDLAKYSEKCVFNSDCDQTQVLVCLNYSTCGCSSTMFWSTVNSKCIDRLKHGESCSGNQCKANIGLVCNSGVCSCTDNTKFYWNGNMCVSKKNFDQICYSTTECMDSEATYCDGSKCTCTNMQYFSNSLSKCTPRLGEDVGCEYTNMCLSPMFCSAFLKCSCPMTQYFNETINDCIDKKLNGETCLLTHHCRSDLGLTCQNNICLCTSPKYSWYSADYECKLTYSQTTCFDSSDCYPLENLMCLSNYCTCASIYYWNTTLKKCSDRFTYGESCNGDQCKINVNLTCSITNFKCDCHDNTKLFWEGNACIPKKNFNEICNSTFQCLDSELTYCDGSKCVCNITNYFDPTLSYCTPKLGEFATCPFNNSCISPMYCPSTTSKCECVLDTQYFDSSVNNCVNKKSINESCNTTHNCRSDYGLSCISNVCSCNTKYTWYSAGSECRLTYSYGNCNSDSDCNPSENLACNSGNKKCYCIKVKNNETYWDGNQCTSALSFGGTCTNNNECKSITEGTYCNLNTNKCDCSSAGAFSNIENYCKTCHIDETFHKGYCYFKSNYTGANRKKRDDAKSDCKDDEINGIKRESSLLVVNSTEINDFIWTFLNPGEEYWMSGKENSGEFRWFDTDQPVTTNICNYLIDPSLKEALYYSTTNKCFYNNRDKDDKLNFICMRFST